MLELQGPLVDARKRFLHLAPFPVDDDLGRVSGQYRVRTDDTPLASHHLVIASKRKLEPGVERRAPGWKLEHAARQHVDLVLLVVVRAGEDPRRLRVEEKARLADAIAADIHQAASRQF